MFVIVPYVKCVYLALAANTVSRFDKDNPKGKEKQ